MIDEPRTIARNLSWYFIDPDSTCHAAVCKTCLTVVGSLGEAIDCSCDEHQKVIQARKARKEQDWHHDR